MEYLWYSPSMPDRVTLTIDDVLALHDDVMTRLTRLGQTPAPIRGGGLILLEAALARPQQAAFYAGADVFQQAALLAIGIAQAHGFVDGNKRTAAVVMIVFLRQVSLAVRAGAEMEFAHRLETALEASRADRARAVDALAVWLRAACQVVRT